MLSQEQISTFCLVEIEKLLNKKGKSLSDFKGLSHPALEEIKHLDNILIREQLIYDAHELKRQHDEWKSSLNQQQLEVYESVIHHVTNYEGSVFFVYGHGGAGKTYLYCTIAAKLRSEGKTVLNVASSGKYFNNPLNYQFHCPKVDL